MRPVKLNGLSAMVVLGLSSFLSVGCYANQQDEIRRLKGQYNELLAKAKGERARAEVLQKELVQAEGLRTRLKSTQLQLVDARKRLDKLEGKSQPGPAGHEKPLYTKTLAGDILFSAGRASLTKPGKERLNQIVSVLKGDYAGQIIRVYGHTDSDPIRKTRRIWKDNLDLSANRAMAVTRYLISRGVNAANVETVAMGARRPVAGNRTKEGKARNRRVEIVVLKR